MDKFKEVPRGKNPSIFSKDGRGDFFFTDNQEREKGEGEGGFPYFFL